MILKSLFVGIATILVFTIVSAGQTPKSVKSSKTETEVRSFFDSYGDDLRQHRRNAIAERYDGRGAYFMGNGRKSLQTYEEIKDRYLNKWGGPRAFEWSDVSVEVISDSSALVTARFVWTPDAGDPAECSYTGLFLKRSGSWRIRAEDESCGPRRPSTSK